MAETGRQLACVLLLELLVRCLPQNVPSIYDSNFQKKLIDEHNKFRSNVNPPATNMMYMSWDPALAKTAEVWASKCRFDHNPATKQYGKAHPTFTTLGENIALGTMAPTQLWQSEVKVYDYSTHGCSGTCGHYTQVVWASSYKLGCAAKKCSSLGNAVLFVCDYGPAGNYRGAKPYETGARCSKCADGDRCVNNLCTNPERDQIIGYGSWSPISAECTQNCHIVLGFHLVCVVLTFVVDIVLQKV
ncbi:GLIPR1-like protein 1 isoform X2 [Lissotriton helveticus]